MTCLEFKMFAFGASMVVGLALVCAVYAFAMESVDRSSQKYFASSPLGSKLSEISSEIWEK
jgi:hypothetical protein